MALDPVTSVDVVGNDNFDVLNYLGYRNQFGVADYLACRVCGEPAMVVSQRGPQRKTCDGACRVTWSRRNSTAGVWIPCLECGEMLKRRNGVEHPFCDAECRKQYVSSVDNRLDKTNWPSIRVGKRSLKTLKSDTYGLERKLTTTTVMRNHPDTPVNVNGPAWEGHRARVER